MSEFLSKFRLLPLVVLVTIAAFAVRVGDTMLGVKDVANLAVAEDVVALEPGQTAGDINILAALSPAAGDQKEEDATPSVDSIRNERARPNIDLPEASLPEVWSDPGSEGLADSPEQMRLLQDLAKRRQQLDSREQSIVNREALLKATEKQLDSKIVELTSLRVQIEKLLGQQEGEEEARVKSLVKIYEGMKAKEAAAIFNQLHMSILLQVASQMSERKVAPIIAKMDTSKANELTVRIMEMNKLPKARKQASQMGFKPMATSAPPGSAPLPGLDALGAP